LEFNPTLTLDDGADLIVRVHGEKSEYADGVIGGTEETTTGVHRLRAMGKAGDLKYPVIAVNDAITKWDFDNVYGTGQSTIDGIIRATSVLVAGKTFVVAGYGHCGKGVAMRAQGMGANVIITEVDPLPALRAVMDGFRVMTMDEAAKLGDIFCTATGMKDVIVDRHFASMKDGAIISNTGHYDCEINIEELTSQAFSTRTIRDNNVEYTMKDGRKIFLLADGRLVNLAAAEGHPSEVMDMSFANQYLALCRLAKEGSEMKPIVYDITTEQDQGLATTKLATLGFEIDSLTNAQIAYLDDYNAGT
jgi:adenosylhomocysteinase